MNIRDQEALIQRIADVQFDQLSLEDYVRLARVALLNDLYAMRDEELVELAEEMFIEVDDA